ncbi:hypothetical protein [Aliiglaciecola lipolytica]|uniref:Uncharacterized protein n=1 Tax=Aliiglaciecola lipolytica E3 TaxID=1127673 RepID=K6XRX0_9ALTE|nr:hypothetical protein [Aliiglaciecola lipolytica]GAC14426.1 hypothetical protein GLIP_1797 [Aliiglaciecola lipolytica E3]
MANERLDNDLPNIVLDKEDREAFQRARAKEKSKPQKNKEPNEGTKGGVSGFWLILVFIIAVGACGASYWLYQQKVQSDLALDNAISRVSELERRLSATGEEMDQSAGALRVTVSELTEKTDELWAQMDKLWASAWRRNQADITQLSDSVKQQNRETLKKLGVMESDFSTVSTNLVVLQEQLTQQANELAQLSTILAEVKTDSNNNAREVGDIQAKLVALDQVNGALTRRVAELEKWRRNAESTPSVP